MKFLRYLCVAVSVMALALVVGCGNGDDTNSSKSAETVSVTIKGQSVTVPKDPKRVVVLDFGALDGLDSLGLGDRVVGVPKGVIPGYLAQYKDEKYTDIGNLMEYNMETISKLKPDLIIIGGRQEAKADELRKIAPVIDLSVDTTHYMDSFHENMNALGRIWGKEDVVKAKVSAIDDQISALQKKIAASPDKGIFLSKDAWD